MIRPAGDDSGMVGHLLRLTAVRNRRVLLTGSQAITDDSEVANVGGGTLDVDNFK